MKRSAALRNTTLQFYDRFSASDLASFDAFVSKDAKLFSGTADDEWFTDREKPRGGFGLDGLRLEVRDPQGWEEGPIGWVSDRPVMYAPGIGPIRTRFTGVLRLKEGTWKLAMSHFSVGVPDEEVVELQHRWLGGRSGSDR